jgi:riboflavin kinase / FMN adenylyltransferase
MTDRPAFGQGDRVVTVGTFDGVHRGHAHLLARVLEAARERAAPTVLVTFDPHPLRVVRPAVAPQLLTTPAEKVEILAATGLDAVAILRFDRDLAAATPREFVEQWLIRRFGLAHLVVGYDHAFGRNRSGDVDTLRALAEQIGFGIDVVGPVATEAGPLSSTRIRAALAAGEVVAAAEALGRPYLMRGTVVHGDARGRALGFPTANLRLPPEKLVPAPGIYAGRAHALRRTFDAVLHIGPRPTFAGAAPTIEVHLFDFDGDLYGRELRVDLCARLRDIERYDDVPSLVRAMEADARAAKRVLAEGGAACGMQAEPLA